MSESATNGDGASGAAEPDIERQRAELAATVGELTDRLDVPTRVRHAADERVEAVRERPDLVALVAGVLAVTLAVVVWRRRRGSAA
jgi:hypothetical protein